MFYTPITDRNRKIKLLDEMVDWRRSIAPVAQVSQGLTTWLIDMPVYWSKVTLDCELSVADTERWMRQHGVWNHSGAAHNQIGMAFAWHLSQHPHIHNVELNDGPDIYAELDPDESWADQSPARIVGDIGKCSVSALYDGLQTLAAHDMWISVRPDGSHIALAMDYNIGSVMMNVGASRVVKSPMDDDTIRKLLTCKRCLNEVTEEQIAAFRQGFGG